jgi:caffeoyl-CoA O-methyltransferase
MHAKFTPLTPEVYAYLVDHRSDRDPVLDELAAATRTLGDVSVMQIAAEQGAFLTMLVRLVGARSIVEVGTFTGYSALCLARGLPPDGRLLCCDVSEEWTAIGRRHWEKAGVAGRIDLRIAPALDTLRALPPEASFDMAFIDADKPNYAAYYEEILARLRPNGVILFDNVLWSGQVANPAATDTSTLALRALNDALVRDPRVDVVMLPIADGLTLARKKG